MGSGDDNTFTYFVYATKRWGLAEGVKRTWKHYVSPSAQLFKYRQWAEERRRIDRREKKNYSRTVYAINRDGDMYVVECPSCNDHQGVWCFRPSERSPDGSYLREAFCDICQSVRRMHFHCGRCGIGFDVHLEDGFCKIQDHRDGVPPFPTKLVIDDNGGYHMGISADAPWWWKRTDGYRDYNPENGKDGHGHELYRIYRNPPQMGPGQCEQEQIQL